MITYAGIGSRKSPPYILTMMTDLAKKFDTLGYVLRSGGATGADQAFEKGSTDKVIFLARHATLDAINAAKGYHPKWEACDEYARKLHGRNMMIILGEHLNYPVDFVVCWTTDAKIVGGTGQALRVALKNKIPVYNLADAKVYYKAFQFLKDEKVQPWQ